MADCVLRESLKRYFYRDPFEPIKKYLINEKVGSRR
jgi:hypothetical protein